MLSKWNDLHVGKILQRLGLYYRLKSLVYLCFYFIGLILILLPVTGAIWIVGKVKQIILQSFR